MQETHPWISKQFSFLKKQTPVRIHRRLKTFYDANGIKFILDITLFHEHFIKQKSNDDIPGEDSQDLLGQTNILLMSNDDRINFELIRGSLDVYRDYYWLLFDPQST